MTSRELLPDLLAHAVGPAAWLVAGGSLLTMAGPARAGVAGSPAPASEQPDRVATLPASFDGIDDAFARRTFADSVGDGLVRGGSDVIEVASSQTCSDEPCLTRRARERGARYAVKLTVRAQGRDYDLSLELRDLASGETLASAEESCEVCGIREVATTIEELAALLQRRLRQTAESPTTLELRTRPSGARIRIDDRDVGAAPLSHAVEPGEHRVEASKPGYVPQIRVLSAVAGTREVVRFELEPAARDQPRRIAGWTLVGVGGAAVITGVTFLSLAGRPFRSRCSGADVDPDGDCRFRYETLPHGIAFTVAGVTAAATGVALLLVSQRRRARKGREALR